ncbi:unnamed protein product [Dracunculus medinensis]|uniref:Secreted protein n=1 Tax=Dracunculus medinensis TaxID=318479 RepID=A0A0N4UD86_DRAME|nr:unnamed protein product [Dracunculus medinensis]
MSERAKSALIVWTFVLMIGWPTTAKQVLPMLCTDDLDRDRFYAKLANISPKNDIVVIAAGMCMRMLP